MHGKQAQRGLRLHCIEFHFLINNLVEGAHPPPQLPHRRTASYIHSPTRGRPAGARTRPPDPPLLAGTLLRAHLCARAGPTSACLCQWGALYLQPGRTGGGSHPRIFLRRGRSICLSSKQQEKQRVMGRDYYNYNWRRAEGKTKWFIVPQDPLL